MGNRIEEGFLRGLRPQEEYKLLGFNPQSEAERWEKLEEEFGELGNDIFYFEHEKNGQYKREFLEDVPYSFPNLHWFSYEDGKLYTQINNHPLFKIENLITREERNGLTYAGYENLQKEIYRSPETVVVSYSPADPPGSERRSFDSGRLCLSWCFGHNLNITFDLKVLEEEFPILDFLNRLSGQEAEDEFFYLTHPFNTGCYPEEFFKALEEDSLSGETIYISHRLEEDPQPARVYSLADLIAGVRKELNDEFLEYQLEKLEEFQDRLENYNFDQGFVYQPIGDKTTDLLERAEKIRAGYLGFFGPYIKNNKLLFLYGCSASGLRTLNGPFFSSFEVPISNSSGFLNEKTMNNSTNQEINQERTVTCPNCKNKVSFNPQKVTEDGVLECPYCHYLVNDGCAIEAIVCSHPV